MRFAVCLLRLLRDCRAVAAIEMAFALPVLCTMTFALYEVTQGVICYMKVADAANSVADLIGQTSIAQAGIGNNDFDNFYLAGQLIMNPNSGNSFGLSVASVYFDNTGQNPVENWHVERGGAPPMVNATTFVSNLGTPNGSSIIVSVSYSYISALTYFLQLPINFSIQVAAQPRNLIPPTYKTGIPCPPPNGSQSCS